MTPTVERRQVEGAVPLEVLYCPQSEAAARTPLVFVHGAYVGAWCWAEHFLPWFAAHGFPVCALSLRGHGRSGGREHLHTFGIADYVEDLAQVAADLPRAPVLIGHSMGALVVTRYLERTSVPAAVMVCPVPPFGLLPSTFSLAFSRPRLFGEINALAAGHGASRAALAEALFAGPVDAARVERHYARMQAESRRALLDMSWGTLPHLWLGSGRAPHSGALVLGAERDVLISPALAVTAAGMLGAEYRVLDGLGHAVMLEARWETAARTVLGWLQHRGL